MKRTCIWVALAAVLGVGCGEEDSGLYYASMDTLYDSWDAYGVYDLEVSTPSGDIEVDVGQGYLDPENISASIERVCYSKHEKDLQAYLGNVSLDERTGRHSLYVFAEMPEPGRLWYTAGFRVETPVLDSIVVTTGEGDVDVSQQRGRVYVDVGDGHVKCDVAETNNGDLVAINVERGFVYLSLPADASATFNIRNDDGTVWINGFDSLMYHIAVENEKMGIMGEGLGDASISIDIGWGDVVIEGR